MRSHPDRVAAMTCVAIGVLMATLPHLITWSRTGSAAWLADNDERFYLAVASQAYVDHPWRLADPVRAQGGPSLYRPLPLLPGVWTAKLLGLGPLGIGLAWRIGAGATIALAWYALMRRYEARPWAAAALAVILLCDGGLIEGRPLYRQVGRVAELAIGRPGTLFLGKPLAHPEWRVSTPAVTMAYLIALLWALSRARERPSRGRIALAGLTFGLLFYVYFYYWTAAGLALLIALALDAGHRRVYFQAGWIGGLIGLPAVVSDFLLKRNTPPDWLHRTDKFLPIGRFDELIAPKVMLVLLAAGLVWALVRRRDLIHVWALAAAGLILSNHQIITKLQIENFHWCYVWGPAVSLFLVLAVWGEWSRRSWGKTSAGATRYPDLSSTSEGGRTTADAPVPRARGSEVVLFLTVGFILLSGLWLRALEATRSHDCLVNARALADYLAARRPGLASNAVVGGDPTFVDFAAILDNLRPLSNYWVTLSPTVTDPEWDERIALNSLLLGLDRATFEAVERARLVGDAWGPWRRDPALRDERLVSRLTAFDRDAADLPSALARYGVRYVALPVGASPAYLLADGWRRLEATGPPWSLWERPRDGFHPGAPPSATR